MLNTSKPVAATILVDKIAENNIGGFTTDISKIKHNLTIAKQTIEGILDQTIGRSGIPTVMFHLGRYAVIFQIDRDQSNARMAFIDYKINLDDNFDHFADFLSPQAVAGFHKTQQIIAKKSLEELDFFVLSEYPLMF